MTSMLDIEIEDGQNLKAALEEALLVIKQYQLDIRNAEETIEVDLLCKGFCQGKWYLEAMDRIKRKLNSKPDA